MYTKAHLMFSIDIFLMDHFHLNSLLTLDVPGVVQLFVIYVNVKFVRNIDMCSCGAARMVMGMWDKFLMKSR